MICCSLVRNHILYWLFCSTKTQRHRAQKKVFFSTFVLFRVLLICLNLFLNSDCRSLEGPYRSPSSTLHFSVRKQWPPEENKDLISSPWGCRTGIVCRTIRLMIFFSSHTVKQNLLSYSIPNREEGATLSLLRFCTLWGHGVQHIPVRKCSQGWEEVELDTMHMTHPDLFVTWKSLEHFDFFFLDNYGVE